MDEKIVEIIKNDIDRCNSQTENEGSYELYQALLGKYNGLFAGFSDDIPQFGKAASVGEAFNYRPELNAIKEKLELLLVTEQSKDSLFKFKEMMTEDIEQLQKAIDDKSFPEDEKKILYMAITAKYHPYVPQFGNGLYQYYDEQGFYEEVSGSSLEHNLRNIYNKLLAFRSLNYPGLGTAVAKTPSTVVNITNSNENNNNFAVSFETARDTINSMTSLPDEEIQEIQKRINELERIVNSKESKSKKWSKAKEIVKWVADKGVDVGIALLPLLLQIS